jgi:hypothetical protein
VITTQPTGLPGKVRLTFSGGINVWGTRTKRTPLGASSAISSETEFDATSLPIQVFVEGVSGSTTFRDAELRATYLPNGANDVVKVTVIEVELTGFFGYGDQQQDDERRMHQFHGSSDHDGMISWDDLNADGTKGDLDSNCWFFRNCMECQGTIKPSGVTNQVSFHINRYRWARAWIRLGIGSWTMVDDSTPWMDDNGGLSDDEDLTPSASDHIYNTDSPGFPTKDRGPTYDHLVAIGDFKEWVTVSIGGNWYQCSNYYKWHTKCYTQPKDASYMTRDSMDKQALGSGWITVPTVP